MFAALATKSILVVEDSPELVALLDRLLREHGYEVRTAADGDAGLATALYDAPDLVILDVGLPGRDGFEVMRELRRHGFSAPALMLTARGEVADRITGLESGADDYLVKPFDTDELVARVRALFRRSGDRRRAAATGRSHSRSVSSPCSNASCATLESRSRAPRSPSRSGAIRRSTSTPPTSSTSTSLTSAGSSIPKARS